ncbi:hypothetical protein [Sandaracinus amylolyticus]|nr:hypothetical protein [Sandaracinus amylolyticus]
MSRRRREEANRLVLDEARATLDEREAAASAAVLRWRWGRRPAEQMLPLRLGGEPIATPATPHQDIVEYGEDADGRLRIVREYELGKHDVVHTLTVYTYGTARVTWSQHDSSAARRTIVAGTLTLDDGQPVEATIVNRNERRTERYIHHATRLVQVEVARLPSADPRGRELRSTMHVSSDTQGITAVDETTDGGRRRAVYRRRNPHDTVESVADAFLTALKTAVDRVARALPREPPIAAIALVWSGHPPLPPFVTSATPPERADPALRWAFADWARILPADEDLDVQDAALRLSALAGPDAFAIGVDVARRAAARLRANDWSELNVTNDFTIVACDYYLEELERACQDAGSER